MTANDLLPPVITPEGIKHMPHSATERYKSGIAPLVGCLRIIKYSFMLKAIIPR